MPATAIKSYISEPSRSSTKDSHPVTVRLMPEFVGALDKMTAAHSTSRRAFIQALIHREAVKAKILDAP